MGRTGVTKTPSVRTQRRKWGIGIVSPFLMLIIIVAACGPRATKKPDSLRTPPAPLYRDPVFDGAADPSLVWNDKERAWWIFYTNRRANAVDAQDGVRWWDYRSIRKYCRALAEGKPPVDGTETLSTEQLRLEALYLGFRTRDGVSMETLHNSSPRAERILSRLQESGLVRVLQNRALPTREGFAVADRLPLLFSE